MSKYTLEQLPLTETGKRMLARVSPVYDQSWYMKKFYDALGAELEPLRQYFLTLREQHFIETVDWGIEYLEHKYSLEPRPDLTLEERRARLGIKARKHLPLNPAVMEQYIKEHFGLTTYLSEDLPGHIQAFMNHLTEDGWNKMIAWLLKEKPAHLVLDTTLHILSYTGDPPDLPTDKVIKPDEIPLPKTHEDKKKFRHISAGNILATAGTVNVDLPKPKGSKATVHAGNVLATAGVVDVGLRRPQGSKTLVRVGSPFLIGGHVLIDSGEQPLLRRIRENPVADMALAGVAIARGNNLNVPPEFDLLKIFFKFPDGKIHRSITIRSPRPDVTNAEIKAVGDYAVDNDLLLDREQETSDQAPKAHLILKKITTLI